MRTIGLDIGGTKIRGVLWDGKTVVRALETRTPKTQKDFQKTLSTLITLLSGRGAIRGIGIGAAGIVEKTTLVFSPNIPYIKEFDFRRLWPLPRSLRLDNDARCFARAEMICGAGRGSKNLFGLTIGTGIGRAYGRDGKILRLKKFEYPERWEKQYQEFRKSRNDQKLAAFLGEKLSLLLLPFQPEVVVIGGGVLKREDFFAMLRTEFRNRQLRSSIRRAIFQNNGVAVGAALLIENRA
jgi:predicted NBD/HSP70 family sugar kinase